MRILAAALVVSLEPQAGAEEKPFYAGDVFFLPDRSKRCMAVIG